MKKRVVITGASDGIGRAIAIRMHTEYEVILCGRNEERLQAVAAECNNARYVAFDINDLEAQKRAAEDIGQIDILINNAGVWHKSTGLDELDDETIIEVLNTNLVSQILLTKKFLPDMQDREGTAIINIVSSAGMRGNAGRIAYAPSKFGMRGFTEVLREDTKKKPLRVAAVFQSGTNTGLFEKAGESEDDFPRSEYIEPADLADVIAFMLSRPKKLWINEVGITR